MTVTTTTSVTEIVPAEFVRDIIMDYAIDMSVVIPHAVQVQLPEGSGKTYNFPQAVKDSAADLTTEGTTTFTPTEFETTEVSVSVGVTGLARENTKLMLRSNRLGEMGFLDYQLQDAARLLVDIIETDLCALFTSMTDTAGSTGVNLGIGDILTAIAYQRSNCAKGQLVFILDDQQAADLASAVAATTSTVFGGGAGNGILQARANGYMGNFLGADFYYSNLCTTANTGADVVGACIVSGPSNPAGASLGLVTLWTAEIEEYFSPTTDTNVRSYTSAYGVGLIGDSFSTKIVTDL
jgi:hypothetical protein